MDSPGRPKTAKERRKSLQRRRSVTRDDEDEVYIQVEAGSEAGSEADDIVEVHASERSQQEQRQQRLQLSDADGDDTLNNMRVPSLEKDEEANVETVQVSMYKIKRASNVLLHQSEPLQSLVCGCLFKRNDC